MEPSVGNMQTQYCIFVVLSLITGLQASGCSSDFTKVGEKCYKALLEKVNWFEADRRCRAMHASLMIFDDENDREISTNYMKDMGISFADNYNNCVWMGINCFGNNRQFVASHDGSALPFEKWLPGEPNNEKGNEECVAYSYVNGYGFNDHFCASSAHQYVCQTRFKYY